MSKNNQADKLQKDNINKLSFKCHYFINSYIKL